MGKQCGRTRKPRPDERIKMHGQRFVCLPRKNAAQSIAVSGLMPEAVKRADPTGRTEPCVILSLYLWKK